MLRSLASRPEQELVLLLSGTRERRDRHRSRIQELLERCDGSEIASTMAAHRLLPILVPRARDELPLTGTIDQLSALAKPTEMAASARGGFFSLALSQVERDLEACGIRVLPLKGPALSELLYGDAGARQVTDLDVLVTADALWPAADGLRKRGYDLEPDPADSPIGLPRLHLRLRHREELLPPVELHWRVHWYETSFAPEMLAKSRSTEQGRRALPAHELASLMLFFARDGFQGLRLAVDVASWWDIFGETGDASPVLAPVLDRFELLAPALIASAKALDATVGVPFDRTVGSTASPDRLTRAAVRFRNWTGIGHPDQLSANVTLIDGLLTPRGERIAYSRRWLFPRSAELRRVYGIRRRRSTRLAFWRLAHPLKLAARYALAIARVARREQWSAPPPFQEPQGPSAPRNGARDSIRPTRG